MSAFSLTRSSHGHYSLGTDQRSAGFASYSFRRAAAGLSSSRYLEELHIASAYRRTGIGKLPVR
jgi:hypothetical protein